MIYLKNWLKNCQIMLQPNEINDEIHTQLGDVSFDPNIIETNLSTKDNYNVELTINTTKYNFGTVGQSLINFVKLNDFNIRNIENNNYLISSISHINIELFILNGIGLYKLLGYRFCMIKCMSDLNMTNILDELK